MHFRAVGFMITGLLPSGGEHGGADPEDCSTPAKLAKPPSIGSADRLADGADGA
jgi:hypothetical protein